MHIAEGAISATPSGIAVLVGGGLLTALGTAVALRRLTEEDIPQTALLSTAFFVASFIHVPLGVTSVHLVLNGLVGLVLGWAAFPAILVALWFQAILFGHGGLTTLGINTFCMATPAVLCHYLCRPLVIQGGWRAACAGFLAGMLGVATAGWLVAGALALAGRAYFPVAGLFALAATGWAAVEGLVSMAAASTISALRPELLGVIPSRQPPGVAASDRTLLAEGPAEKELIRCID
ncbi:MAG: cobalt transporter CbiM [Thermoguttaceae bacterium]|nr:cobalt transporter CbiM [Thermoguttaceae bacterium]MDW8078647.1 cobalt transporter CbiM [Thermoguttaceae bacterium]